MVEGIASDGVTGSVLSREESSIIEVDEIVKGSNPPMEKADVLGLSDESF